MNKSSGLGRGLSSLIPSKKIAVDLSDENIEAPGVLSAQEQVLEIPVEKIVANPHQPRSGFNNDGLAELAQSIREHGIIQPLIATKVMAGWQLIAGERRLRAAKIAGLRTVPVIVREVKEHRKLELALIENLQRQDLNPLEMASAYQKLIDQFNLTTEELGKKVGKSQSAVANTLRIINIIDEAKEAVRGGRISEGHARVLAGLPQEDQREMLSRIIDNKFNVREAEKAGREVVVKKHIRKLPFDPEVKMREEELQAKLGTKVEIKKFGGAGQIIIRFYSDEEFREVTAKLL